MTSHFQNLGRKGPECRAHVGPPTGEHRGLAAERALESSLTPFVWLKSSFLEAEMEREDSQSHTGPKGSWT